MSTGIRADERVAKWFGLIGLAGSAVFASVAATALTDIGDVPGLTRPEPLVHLGLPVVRVLLNVSAVATVGLSILPRLIAADRPARMEPIMARARRTTVITAVAWLAAVLILLLLQTAELNPRGAVTTGMVADYVTGVPAGSGLLLSGLAAFACAVLGLLAVRYGEALPADLRSVVALLGLLPMPLTGHADHRAYDLSLVSIELHVLAASLWTGGLLAVVVFVAPRRGLLATTLPRLSVLATIALCTVGVSGAANGIMELTSTPGVGLGGLVTTGYGRIVVVKLLCLAVLAAIGGVLRFRLLPRIVRRQRTALLWWVALEISVLGLAYGSGAALARAPVVG